MTWLVLIVAAYLLGSIPFGVVIARSRGIDIRAHGSGNIGATNIGRTLGRSWGIVCLVLDMSKGAIPMLVAGSMHGLLDRWALDVPAETSWLWLAVAAAAVLGHMFSVFLGFTGGKGVATAFGALLGAWPMLAIPALGALALWVVVILIARIVSLASMVAAASLPLVAAGLLWLGPAPADLPAGEALERSLPVMALTLGIAAMVLWRHRDNLRRLIAGSEPRLGDPQDK